MGQGGRVTLVNGTSYDWSLNSSANNEYQMASWDWPSTVKAGQSVVVYVEWKQGPFTNLADTQGNAQYKISGTSHNFTIQARSSSDSTSGFRIQIAFTDLATVNLGSGSIVNLGWAHDGQMTFVLAGVEGKFVSTNMPTDWMQQTLGTIGYRALRHVCIPGTHDAGMSVLGSHTVFINNGNVLTQYTSIGNQLNLGSRYLDIRPCISSGKYVTGHYSSVDAGPYKGWQGANGQSIADIINDLNAFTAKNKELVILNLSHAYNTDAGNNNYPDFNQAQWDGLLQQLASGVQNLFVSPGDYDLTNLTISQFIGGSKAAVVIVVEPGNISLGFYAGKGFYTYGQVNAWNKYADSNDVNQMISDQTTKMKNNRQNPNQSYFLLSWTLTQNGTQAFLGTPSILDLANQANPRVHVELLRSCSKQTYPNIIMVDGMKDSDVAALAVAVNTVFGS